MELGSDNENDNESEMNVSHVALDKIRRNGGKSRLLQKAAELEGSSSSLSESSLSASPKK